MILDLFLITFLCVFVIDISGFIDEVETMLGKWLKGKVIIPKPISCSLCMSWWVNLVYLLCVGEFTIPNISIVALFAILTPVLATLIICVREALTTLVQTIINA